MISPVHRPTSAPFADPDPDCPVLGWCLYVALLVVALIVAALCRPAVIEWLRDHA